MAKARVGSPLGVALVAAVLAGLITALVLSFVLDDGDDDAAVPDLTLDPDAPQVTITAPPNTSVGEQAPDFSYEDFATGEDADFSDFRDGRPALINFFSRTCAPCVVEMPDLEQAYQAFGDRVAFLGLAYQDHQEQAEDLIEQTGVTYPTGRDNGDVLTAYEGTGLPTTVFIAADGQITEIYTRKMHPDEMQRELEALVT